MNLRIPLSVFVASVIGLMAVTTIAAMSMQKAYSQTAGEWCFKEKGVGDRCFSSKAICDQEEHAAGLTPNMGPTFKVERGCEQIK